MRWQVGDVAILLYTPTGKGTGQETTVLSCLRPAKNDTTSKEIKQGDLVHEIDAKARGGAKLCISRPEWLGRLPDGNQASTWEDMRDIWEPQELVIHE